MSVQEYELTIAIGGVGMFPVYGNTLQLFEASGVFSYGASPSTMVEGRIGDIYAGDFNGFYVRNDDASQITVKLRYGTGIEFQPLGDRSTVNFDGTQPVNIQNWNVPNTGLAPGDKAVVGSAAAVAVSVSRGTKLQTIITNPASSPSRVRIGPAGVDDTKGRNLSPGETAVYDGSMARYAYNPHTTLPVTLEIEELDRV